MIKKYYFEALTDTLSPYYFVKLKVYSTFKVYGLISKSTEIRHAIDK